VEHKNSMSVLNILLSLSDAMDLAGPELVNHQLRTAYIAWEMVQAASLSDADKEQIFYAALLHDIGAISVEEKYAILASRAEEIEEHCARGELLLSKLPWLSDAAVIVGRHHREWRDFHQPIDDPFVMGSQIVFLADSIERMIDRNLYILHQNREITSKIVQKTGQDFHPDVADLFISLADREDFWLDLTSKRLYSLLLHSGPVRRFEFNLDNLYPIAETFSNVIDFRSHFTATHSAGVSSTASTLARIYGLSETEVAYMEIAGLLHDLGKIAIPNSILEKPDKLTREEFAVIKSHTYYTYAVLNSIQGFHEIAEWSAFHHEKLDGSGYPFHCRSSDLSLGARIMMVADIFTAVAENRPYREGMSEKEVLRILEGFSQRRLLEKRVVDLLLDNYQDVYERMRERQEGARDFFKNQYAVTQKTVT